MKTKFFYTLGVFLLSLPLNSCDYGQRPFHSSYTFEFESVEVDKAKSIINFLAYSYKLKPYYESRKLLDPLSERGQSFYAHLVYEENKNAVVSIGSILNYKEINMVTRLNAGLNESELDLLIKQFKTEFELRGWHLKNSI